MIVKMIKNLENKMEKMQKSMSKDLEELKNKHTKRNNTITEMASHKVGHDWSDLAVAAVTEGINSRIS